MKITTPSVRNPEIDMIQPCLNHSGSTMSRGKFITLAASAATLAIIPRSANATTTQRKSLRFKTGCQSYTFRLFSIYEAIEKTAAAGGNVIELCLGAPLSPEDESRLNVGINDQQIKNLRAHLSKHKFIEIGCFTAIPNDIEKSRELFRFIKQLGAQSVSTESVASIDTIEKMVKEFDIRVGFHNHPMNSRDPNYKLWNPEYIRDLVKDRDPRIGACADNGHWVTSGLDTVKSLKILEGRVINLHLKDRTAVGKSTTDQIFGRGILDFQGILTELNRQKFLGCLFIEYETNWENSVPDVRQCVNFLGELESRLKLSAVD